MGHNKTCNGFPPNFNYHLFKGNAPDIYIWFWAIGGVAWLTVLAVLIPHIIRLRRSGVEFRNRSKDLFVAEAFQNAVLICCYPVVLATCKFFILLSPSYMFALDFVAACYEVYAIYLFTQFLIMLMGGHKQSAFLDSLEHGGQVKYWTSFPLACCFRCLERPKYMSHRDFLIVYALILQFCVTAPFWAFIMILKDTRGDNEKIHWTNWCNSLTAVCCIYGLFVLMRGTMGVLHPYNPRGKFFSIQSLFLSTIVPSDIMTYFKLASSQGGRYSTNVMRGAWTSIITLVFCALISIFYRRFWHRADCQSAQISFEQRRIIAVPSTMSLSGYEHLREAYNKGHTNSSWDGTVTPSRHDNGSISFQAITDDEKNTRLLKMYSS